LALPKEWQRSVQAAMVHVIALAHYAMIYTRSWGADSRNSRVRLQADVDWLKQDGALLREELRIKDSRIGRIPPHRRPHYSPTARLAILELRAARAWSLAQTADVFSVTTATIASWSKRLDEQGPAALVQSPTPVNKFPDFVRVIVQRLQTLCPRLGKIQMAQMLARAGLHLGATTVGRLRRSKGKTPPAPRPEPMPQARRVTARSANHVWHVDLTTVETSAGAWTSWLPFALPRCWPFCWWLALVVDHYSRRVMGSAVYKSQPSAQQIIIFLRGVVARCGEAPRHLVSDQGPQFVSRRLRRWCGRRGVRQRFGAVGRRGSIAVIERFIRTLKCECVRLLPLVPLRRDSFLRELCLFHHWYNGNRAHTTLAGATPDEVYFKRRPACRQPRLEPRPDWPRPSPCARPQVLVKGQPGARLNIEVTFSAGRCHLPCVAITRAA
jgi:putative transposase